MSLAVGNYYSKGLEKKKQEVPRFTCKSYHINSNSLFFEEIKEVEEKKSSISTVMHGIRCSENIKPCFTLFFFFLNNTKYIHYELLA